MILRIIQNFLNGTIFLHFWVCRSFDPRRECCNRTYYYLLQPLTSDQTLMMKKYNRRLVGFRMFYLRSRYSFNIHVGNRNAQAGGEQEYCFDILFCFYFQMHQSIIEEIHNPKYVWIRFILPCALNHSFFLSRKLNQI